jgi:cellobiose phosphorylase
MTKYRYGHFSADGTEFIITDPKTPRAFDNFLWNDSLFSSVHQTGVGFIDYQIGDTEGVQLLTGVGRICDFDVFGRDGLMSRLIYIRDNDSGEFWNLNWEPVKKDYQEFRCIHGLGYSNIQTRVNNLFSGFRIFVPPGKDPLELWTLEFENLSGRQLNLSVFVYNQYLFSYKWGFNSYGDMLFRRSWFSREMNAVMARKKPHISPHDFQTVFLTSDEPIVAFDGSRDFFVGQYNLLNEPEAVVKGRCSNTEGSSDSTIGVAQMDFTLASGRKKNIEMMLGIADSQENAAALKRKYMGRADHYYDDLRKRNAAFIGINHVDTPDAHLNHLLNAWIKHQTSYGARWCRWGWMGYRDIVQHGYGVSSFNPERTREILLEAFQYQYASGMALRGWNPVDEKPYSDSALWLVFTLISYLKETGNMQMLDETIPFYDSGSGTVLEHIEKALEFLEKNKGSHQLCLIKYGDWNDSLTGVGKEGRGESVWLSMAYAEALRQMKGLFDFLLWKEKSVAYQNRYISIKDAINRHAWDGKWYVRCYDDHGNPIGSDQNKEGKIFLNAQSWALIAGIADEDKPDSLIVSADKMLKTEIGYRLLAPTFSSFDPRVGRISCLEPGICENGTVYSHVNVWYMMGLLRAGKADLAYETLKRIAPGYVTGLSDDPKQKVPPYIFANGYFGPDHRNNRFQMEFTWITGSVAWYYNVLMNEMLGIRPGYNALEIDPKIPSEWPEVRVRRVFRGKLFNITLARAEKDKKGLHLNGRKMEGKTVSLDDMQAENTLVFYL